MDRFNVLSEIPPISSEDSFVLFERHKMDFSFPVHIHNECELNYVSGAAGAMRVVGDNIEEIGDRDLVLITGSKLEHAWFNGHKAPDAEILRGMDMICKKPEISASLPRYIRRYISRSARYTDTVVKGDLMVKKGIQNSSIVSAFHSASFYHQSDFLMFFHPDLLLSVICHV